MFCLYNLFGGGGGGGERAVFVFTTFHPSFPLPVVMIISCASLDIVM